MSVGANVNQGVVQENIAAEPRQVVAPNHKNVVVQIAAPMLKPFPNMLEDSRSATHHQSPELNRPKQGTMGALKGEGGITQQGEGEMTYGSDIMWTSCLLQNYCESLCKSTAVV